jgi:hypothetical protein
MFAESGLASRRKFSRRRGAAIRVLPAIVVLLAGLLGSADAAADQTDARLDGLFAQLRNAGSADAELPFEAQIWEIWTQSHTTR